MPEKLFFFLLLATFCIYTESGREKRFSITHEETHPQKNKATEEPNQEKRFLSADDFEKDRRSPKKIEQIEKSSVHSTSNRSRKTRQFGGFVPQLTSPRLTAFPPTNIGQNLPNVASNFPGIGGLGGRVGDVTSQAVSTAQATASAAADVTSSAAASTATAADAFFTGIQEPLSAVEQLLTKEFNSFREQFKKTYSSVQEELFRKEVFIENKKKILSFNENFGLGKLPFVVKLNKYADLLNHEFNQLLNGFNRGNYTRSKQDGRASAFIPSANVQLPVSVDWREAGAVTPVKSQEACGACYAFSAAGALEGHIFRKTGQLRDLSVQNLIDCTRNYGNSGCIGGLMDPAFEYVRDNAGIEADASYPFEGSDTQPCRYKPEGYAAHDTGYVDLDEGDEKGLEAAVATIGPVSAAIDASLESFQFYADGVYFDAKCQNAADKMNHAVLVVGYGTEPDGKQYWLIKNSYGTDWGNGGYMKLAKFANNHCGIATYASYPLV